ncbi:hypothetical protein [Desulforamulus putei]|uniref:Uncharacterized protein n=1 Tax=Desulforamulus putei DSM 12395 TaxID=1121429 RepID=A0A1M4T285_9FIRM|nr:hypothetical protein [Desulforamulus putei]SHE38622.1 hypothetical protein SAMN02745133_00328 [Desulforamulus putei DSM 12395]
MTEQNNVVHLEQEVINKNTEIFSDITAIVGRLMKQGLATFSFNYKETAISFDASPQIREAFAQYSSARVQAVTEEVVDITVKLLDNQEEQMLKQAQDEGKTNYGILQKKINTVKQQIITTGLQNAYNFYRTCIGNVLEQFAAQRVVKPASPQYPSLETVLVKITTRDNMDGASRQTISFELYEDQLDEMINVLTQLKKEHRSCKNKPQ